MEIDAVAKKILFDMHWSSTGWKVPAEIPNAADYEYAKSKGYLFDEQAISHRLVISRFRKSVRRSNLEKLKDLYISSLSERVLHIRPGLPAYFESSKVKWHLFSPDDINMCKICGMFKKNTTHFNSANFARYKWGAYSKDNTSLCNPFILERLMSEPARAPKKEDWGIFKNLISILSLNDASTKAANVVDLWKSIIPSNKQEREILFESFISMGIINPSRVTQKDYDSIPRKSSWSDEAALWRGDDLPNNKIILNIFGDNAFA